MPKYSPALPPTMCQWQQPAAGCGIDHLKYVSQLPLPIPGPHQVLVQMRAWSLNYRDNFLLQHTAFPVLPNNVPLSDGAGVIVGLGDSISRFSLQDRVVITITTFNEPGQVQEGPGLPLCRGGDYPGLATQYVVVDEDDLFVIPSHLSFEEAAALPCAGLTAWSALQFEHRVVPGSTVLIQGTGGVSLCAGQIARAAGCRVIATSSSDDKLKALVHAGIVHTDDCINYRKEPNWGEKARTLTPNGRGVDIVVDVGGIGTFNQSLAAVRRNGVVSLAGILAPDGDQVDLAPLMMKKVTVQGVLVGDRDQFARLLQLYDAQKVHPIVDPKLFQFYDLPKALQYLQSQQHFGKVVVSAVETEEQLQYDEDEQASPNQDFSQLA